jgi:hypothetical protein
MEKTLEEIQAELIETQYNLKVYMGECHDNAYKLNNFRDEVEHYKKLANISIPRMIEILENYLMKKRHIAKKIDKKIRMILILNKKILECCEELKK